MTTTDGIVVDGWMLKPGDMAGPRSAQIVLGIPTVDTAVLEVARGGILREGLGYDYNDVAVVTNVSGDHLGLSGIETSRTWRGQAGHRRGGATLGNGGAQCRRSGSWLAMAPSLPRSCCVHNDQTWIPSAGPPTRPDLVQERRMGGIIEGIVPDARNVAQGRLVVRRGSGT